MTEGFKYSLIATYFGGLVICITELDCDFNDLDYSTTAKPLWLCVCNDSCDLPGHRSFRPPAHTTEYNTCFNNRKTWYDGDGVCGGDGVMVCVMVMV